MEELRKKKVPELKEMLRKMKKKVGGKKAELIDRILGSSSSPSESSQHVIDLKDKFTSKNGKLKLGSLIINIHNNLGGDPSHPYIKKVLSKGFKFDDKVQVFYGNIHTVKGLTFDNVIVDLTVTRREDYFTQLRLKYVAYSRGRVDCWSIASKDKFTLGVR